MNVISLLTMYPISNNYQWDRILADFYLVFFLDFQNILANHSTYLQSIDDDLLIYLAPILLDHVDKLNNIEYIIEFTYETERKNT